MVGEGVDRPSFQVDEGDPAPEVVPAVDALGPVEMLCLRDLDLVGDAPDVLVLGGNDVRDGAFAAPDREVEAEAPTVEARDARSPRLHAATPEEGARVHVRPVPEVPACAVLGCHGGVANLQRGFGALVLVHELARVPPGERGPRTKRSVADGARSRCEARQGSRVTDSGVAGSGSGRRLAPPGEPGRRARTRFAASSVNAMPITSSDAQAGDAPCGPQLARLPKLARVVKELRKTARPVVVEARSSRGGVSRGAHVAPGGRRCRRPSRGAGAAPRCSRS